MPEDPLFAGREFQRKRLDNALSQLVLQPKHMANRSLSGVGTHQRPGCRIRKLRVDADFVARRKQGTGNNQIDVGLGGDGFQVLSPCGKSRRSEAGPYHQRLQP